MVGGGQVVIIGQVVSALQVLGAGVVVGCWKVAYDWYGSDEEVSKKEVTEEIGYDEISDNRVTEGDYIIK